MYTIDDLNVKLLSELKDMAEGMGIKNARKLGKQELVYKILDEQAVSGEPTQAQPAARKEGDNERRMRPRRRENVAPDPEPKAPRPAPEQAPRKAAPEKSSTDDMLQSMDIDLEVSMPRFDEPDSQTQSFEGAPRAEE